MNAVGIDVSKGKSTVTIRRPGDEVVMAPRDIRHTQSSVSELIALIKGMEGETKVCMEHTGRYYEYAPAASLNTSLLTAHIIITLLRVKKQLYIVLFSSSNER